MSTKLTFAEQTMNRFTALETRIQQGSKSLRLVSAYFTNIRKETENFRKALSKSVAPLTQLLQISKRGDDSLTLAVKNVIKISEDYYTAMGKTSSSYQSEVIEPFEIFIGHYEQCNKNVLKEGSKIIEQIESHRAKLVKSREKYCKYAKTFVNVSNSSPTAAAATESEAFKAKEKAMNEAKAEYQHMVEEHNALVAKKHDEYKQSLEIVEQNEQTRVSLIAKNLAKFFTLSEQLAAQYIDSNAKTLKN